MNKAICYIRVSTEEQVHGGVSLDMQAERLTAYCNLAGLRLVEIIREEGISASKPLATRPQGERLVKAIASKKAAHIVAFKLDRLFRDAEDALRQTKAWDKAGVALHLVDMGGQTLNTATAMGRFFLNMMAGFAELERNLIAERTTTAMAHKKKHREVYSPIPYGFDREEDNLIPNEIEQDTIRLMQERRRQGCTLQGIANELNAAGITTKQGSKWYPASVRYVIQNSLYTETLEVV